MCGLLVVCVYVCMCVCIVYCCCILSHGRTALPNVLSLNLESINITRNYLLDMSSLVAIDIFSLNIAKQL